MAKTGKRENEATDDNDGPRIDLEKVAGRPGRRATRSTAPKGDPPLKSVDDARYQKVSGTRRDGGLVPDKKEMLAKMEMTDPTSPIADFEEELDGVDDIEQFDEDDEDELDDEWSHVSAAEGRGAATTAKRSASEASSPPVAGPSTRPKRRASVHFEPTLLPSPLGKDVGDEGGLFKQDITEENEAAEARRRQVEQDGE